MIAIISSSTRPSSTSVPAPTSGPATQRDYNGDKKAFEDLRAIFEAKIIEKYSRLVALKESGDTAGALILVRQFEKFKRTDYEGVATIAKEIHTADALSRLGALALTDTKGLSSAYAELTALHPENAEYTAKAAQYSSEWKKQEAIRIEKERKDAVDLAAANARRASINSQFSAWDGSHRALEEIIKKSMNDPDSYKHVETTYGDKGDYIIVQTTFRGKNAFGGVVKNSLRAKFTIEGRLIEIIE